MFQTQLVDARLFSRNDLNWKDEVSEVAKAAELNVAYSQLQEKGGTHEHDPVALVGAGCAIASLILSLIKLLKQPKERWTYERLREEMDAFMKLRGEDRFVIKEVSGFANLVEGRREPCIVTIAIPTGLVFRVYVGLTSEMLAVGPVCFDLRSLRP